VKLERAEEIAAVVAEVGIDAAVDTLKLQRETIRRAVRLARNRDEPGKSIEPESALFRKLRARYDDKELAAIANGSGLNPATLPRPVLTFEGEDVAIGFCTDTHMGERSFEDWLWETFLDECHRQGVKRILHAGDVHEGMSNRPDQVYHLVDLGVSAQMDRSERLFRMSDIPIDLIDGNHDRWGIKSNGLYMVRDLAARFKNPDGSPGLVRFLGSDYGEISINGTRWMLWHGEDGSSYATSYRVQKLIEAIPVGEEPDVLLCGHTHKEISMTERGVLAVSGGALSFQSAWMRSTRKPCHTGFHIIHARIRDGKIVRFAPVWYPIKK